MDPKAIDAAIAAKASPDFKIPGLIKRNTLIFTATQAFVGMGTQMVPTLSAIIVTSLLGSPALAGVGTSLNGVSRFLIAYPIGQVTDTYGRKAGMLVGLALTLVGAVITGLSVVLASFSVFLVGVLVFGLGVGAGQQLRLAAADMYPPSRRAEGVGYVLTGSWVGALGGPVLVSLAAALAPQVGVAPSGLAWFLVPLVIVPSILLVTRVHPDPKEIAAHLDRYYPGYTPPPAVAAVHAGGAGFQTFVRHLPKRVAFVSSFAAQGNMSMMMAMTPLVLTHHGHALPQVSLSVAIHVVGMYGFSLPLGRIADRLGRRLVLMAGVLLAAAGTILVILTPDYWPITAGLFLVGLGWSCVNVAASALIADTTNPVERGRAIGTNDTFSGASAIALPLVAGLVIEVLGFEFLSFVGAALMITPLVLLVQLKEPVPGQYEDATGPA